MPFKPSNPLFLTTALLLASVAAAQTAGSGFQMTPEMRARMAAMQPIIDLSQTVRLLPELEKNKATAITRTQAKTLLTILTTLQKAAVQPNDAKKYLTQIEDKILTEKQLTALDTLVIKAEKEQQAQRAARQNGQTARVPGIPGGLLGGQRPGGQNAQRQAGTGQAGQRQPGTFNPFKEGRGADALNSYIALLKKK
ncbi:hypothetical protein [Deinococcus aquatilis]|uniref:hypothetical protein n=1 Tax=Deinococcus aquatilis TaxID=519440 RepID=UPI00036C8169|nr:hypothetical protein [Deinococcus aquatilis]